MNRVGNAVGTTTRRRHPRASSVLVTTGASIALIGSFLPWLRSGERNRTSYALFQVVDRLGFASGGVAAWALRLWPLVPFMMTLIITLQWWHPTRTLWRLGAVVLPIVCAVAIAGVAGALKLAPGTSLFHLGIGPVVTALGGMLMLVGAVGAAIARRGYTH